MTSLFLYRQIVGTISSFRNIHNKNAAGRTWSIACGSLLYRRISFRVVLQRKWNTPVEIEYLGAEQVVVFGLKTVGNGFHPGRTRFVVLRSVCLAVGVLLFHQQEGSLCRFVGCKAAVILGFGVYGIVVCLLYFFVEVLFTFLQLPVVCMLLDTGTAYAVTGFKTVEDRNAERETDILAEVVAQL